MTVVHGKIIFRLARPNNGLLPPNDSLLPPNDGLPAANHNAKHLSEQQINLLRTEYKRIMIRKGFGGVICT
ncbi:hypothetical protein [Alloprevotella tannerae]|uniref:hypothetical protein n=1 Tax=Alloprevotella tannerae TaxID=76122 RepID=UPI0028EF334E|nr:hypothetical protein [Alloprevotella tannerae]